MKNKLNIFVNWKLFFVICLEIVFCNLLFTQKVSAFSWFDIFPPLKMEQIQLLDNPPQTEVKTIGPQGVSNNTYINQLIKNPQLCKTKIPVSNRWYVKESGTAPVIPIDARDLNGGQDFSKISNPYTRLVSAEYSNRGVTNIDIKTRATNFKDLSLKGYGYMSKIYSINQKHCLQGQALEETFKSFEGSDTNYSDLQRGWDCSGSFVPMDGKDHNSSCRPVTIGEIAYFYAKNSALYEIDPLLFVDCIEMLPKPLPGSIKGYPGIYKTQFKKEINLLSIEIYQALRVDLPVKALGPSNQDVILTNWGTVVSQWPNFKPGSPQPTTIKRNIPFGAAGNPLLSNQISSINNPRNFASAEFDCADYLVISDNPEVKDIPPILSFFAYVKGLVRAGLTSSWRYDEWANDLDTITERSVIDATINTTNDFANLIPAGDKLDQLKELPASSKVIDNGPIDPGYQSSEVFKTMRSYLLPASWQK
jgi:hypothetical protein